MGERDHDRDQHQHDRGQPLGRPPASRRVTVREAADELGITVEAVRHRIRRRTLASEKEGDKERGTVYVILDEDQLPPGQPGAGRSWTGGQPPGQPEPADQPAELVEELREHVADLREQLREERQANRENRRIIAGLIERTPELPAASHEQPRESPENAAEGEPGTNTSPVSASPQTGAQRRSLWRRIFGG
jgi:hypothetical protein